MEETVDAINKSTHSNLIYEFASIFFLDKALNSRYATDLNPRDLLE